MLFSFFRIWLVRSRHLRTRLGLPLVLLLALPGAAAAQAQTPVASDPDALVRRAVAKRLDEEAAHHPLRFVFRKKDDRRSYTQEIVETAQGDVARLLSVNGSPLTPAAQQAEFNRLNTLAANPALQAHRQKREQVDQARVDKLLRMLPDAFVYTDVGTAPCDVTTLPKIHVPGIAPPSAPAAISSQCYHLAFTPNPDWQPPDLESKILRGMAGDIWIEASSERLHQLNAHLITDVDFGWGIVGRLNQGGTIFLEQDRIGGGMGGNDWELTKMRLNLTGKALLVKTLNIHIDEQESDFEPVPANLDYRQAITMLENSPPYAGK